MYVWFFIFDKILKLTDAEVSFFFISILIVKKKICYVNKFADLNMYTNNIHGTCLGIEYENNIP